MSETPTPGPWHAALTAAGWQIHAGDERCTIIADVTAEADAALIVRAVNAHTALLAACEAILAAWASVPDSVQVPDQINDDALWNAARETIRAAKGEA